MSMSQQELHDWAQKKLRNKQKYEVCALMNFRSYLGGMTQGLEGSAIQLLWARSLAYDAAAKVNNLLMGGWYTPRKSFSYNESDVPEANPPTVFLGKSNGNKQGEISGAGQCAWFMDCVGEDLKGPANLTNGKMAVLGCYHSSWHHNFVVLAPDARTVTAQDVVMVDAWALAFGVPAAQCWGAKADESWLKGAWNGISIHKIYAP